MAAMTPRQFLRDAALACGGAVLVAIVVGVMEIGLVVAIAAASG